MAQFRLYPMPKVLSASHMPRTLTGGSQTGGQASRPSLLRRRNGEYYWQPLYSLYAGRRWPSQ